MEKTINNVKIESEFERNRIKYSNYFVYYTKIFFNLTINNELKVVELCAQEDKNKKWNWSDNDCANCDDVARKYFLNILEIDEDEDLEDYENLIDYLIRVLVESEIEIDEEKDKLELACLKNYDFKGRICKRIFDECYNSKTVYKYTHIADEDCIAICVYDFNSEEYSCVRFFKSKTHYLEYISKFETAEDCIVDLLDYYNSENS